MRRSAASLPPGPRLPRVAQAVLATWRQTQLTDHAHARYGDTYTARVGGLPTSIVTRDRDVIRGLLTGDPLARRHSADFIRPLVGERSVLVLEPAEHLARRRLLLPPFHGERVRSYARLMQRLVDAELDRWHGGGVVVVQPAARDLTLDVILQAVLGVADVELRGKLRKLYDAMFNPLTSFAVYWPALIRRTRWNLLGRHYWPLKDALDALLFEHIATTRADARLAERDDVLAMLVLARDEDGAGLGDEELRDELVTLIAAGHETTAAAIASGVELLAHHPAVVDRIREDADDAYVDAVVKEVLRLRSPVPLVVARRLAEPFAVGPWTVPPGMTVFVNAHGLHHDPRVYPQPDAFRPERFLDDPPDAYAFVPFGGGAHRCLGAALAQLEMKIALGEIARRFDLQPVSRELQPLVRRAAVTLEPRRGARVRVSSRTPAA